MAADMMPARGSRSGGGPAALPQWSGRGDWDTDSGPTDALSSCAGAAASGGRSETAVRRSIEGPDESSDNRSQASVFSPT
jgi:hypothetical protein